MKEEPIIDLTKEEPGQEEAIRPATSLAEAKVRVQAEIAYVQKQKSKEIRYTFATEASILHALQPFMTKYGISVSPIRMKILASTTYESRSGTPMNAVRIRVNYRMSHVSGDSEVLCAIGEAADSSDKACAKAQTIAYKYMLRQAFLIETGDDPDRSRPERGNGEELFQRASAKIQGTMDAEGLCALQILYEQRYHQGKITKTQRGDLDKLYETQMQRIKEGGEST